MVSLGRTPHSYTIFTLSLVNFTSTPLYRVRHLYSAATLHDVCYDSSLLNKTQPGQYSFALVRKLQRSQPSTADQQ